MKKIVLSIITFLYLMLSTGFSVDVHYCMGKFVGVEINGSRDEKCGRCGMTEKKGGCCNDDVRFYKFDDNFKNNHLQQHCSVCKDVIISASVQPVYLVSAVYKQTQHNFLPNPETGGPPLFIRNRVFRI